METKEKRSACSHCIYAIKHYFTIGNKFFLQNVSDCTKNKPNCDNSQSFKEIADCLYFEPNRISRYCSDTEQLLTYLCVQLDEISDALMDIFDKINQKDEDDTI